MEGHVDPLEPLLKEEKGEELSYLGGQVVSLVAWTKTDAFLLYFTSYKEVYQYNCNCVLLSFI